MTKPNDFLEHVFGNPSRARIIRLFVLHPRETFTAVEVARRSKVGAQSANTELESLRKISFLKEEKGKGSTARSKVSYYSVNHECRHLNAISTFVHAISPAEFNEVEQALRRTGRMSVVLLSGVFVGDTTRPADLIVVADQINDERLEKAVKSFEPKYGREVRYAVFSTPEFRYRLTIKDKILRDILDYPHRVLINRTNLL